MPRAKPESRRTIAKPAVFRSFPPPTSPTEARPLNRKGLGHKTDTRPHLHAANGASVRPHTHLGPFGEDSHVRDARLFRSIVERPNTELLYRTVYSGPRFARSNCCAPIWPGHPIIELLQNCAEPQLGPLSSDHLPLYMFLHVLNLELSS